MSNTNDENDTGAGRRKFLKGALAAGAGITFVGCRSADAPAAASSDTAGAALAARDPDTLQAEFPRPVMVNGKRMLTVDIHCHTEVDDVWPLIEGHEELHGENPYGPNPLSKATAVDVRLAAMDATGIDVQALSIAVGQYFHWADPDLAAKIVRV
ncbi:MAG: hypothetical protein MUO51_04120, partial [Woeseiaceae bacterium]|nr:hypothetical protein [Woeseiaceae bacterium]